MLIKKLLLILLILVISCSSRSEKEGKKLNEVQVNLLGAAREVSGSSYYFNTNIEDVLIDCGIFYPGNQSIDYNVDKQNIKKKNAILEFDASSLGAIIITHAHLDHLGKIPLAYKNGFNGKIYSTEHTSKLAAIMFENMILKNSDFGIEKFIKSKYSNKHHTHKNCRWKNKIKKPKSVTAHRNNLSYDSICKTCISLETKDIMSLFSILEYNSYREIFSGFKVELFDAKHIPGSASILITLEINGKNTTLYFSGDVGSSMNSIIQGFPETPQSVDYIFMESTYGNNRRKSLDKSFSHFYDKIKQDIERSQRIWINAFTLDRTQRVLNQLRIGYEKGELNYLPKVFVLSNTAKKINRLYKKYFNFKPPDVLDESYTMSPKYFNALDLKPSIIITPSYIDDLDFFHPLVENIITDSNSSIYIVGYQDPRSIGGQLIDRKKINLGPQIINVNADIRKFSSFSGHLDGGGIIDYLTSIKINKTVFLTHGEYNGMLELKNRIEALDMQCVVPDYQWKLKIK